MSQGIFDTINPSTTSGNQLATILNDFKNAVVSGFSGTTRPSQLQAGGYWIDTTNDGSGLWDFKIYDGTADITIFTLNKTTGVASISSADSLFEVAKISEDSVGPILRLLKERTSDNGQTEVDDILGEVHFSGTRDDGVTTLQARIKSLSTDNTTSTTQGASLVFEVSATGAASISEVMRLVDGRVGIGVTAPENALHVRGNGARVERVADDTVGPKINIRKKRIAASGQVQSGDEIGSQVFKSTDDTGAEADVAAIEVTARETHTTGVQGSKIVIKNKKIGESAFTEQIVIEDEVTIPELNSTNIDADTVDATSSISAPVGNIDEVNADVINVTTLNATNTNLGNVTEIEDPQVVVNKNGTQATADAFVAGVQVEMSDAPEFNIGYKSTVASKFVAGEAGSEKEIVNVDDAQELQNKKYTSTQKLEPKHDTEANLITYAAGVDGTDGQLCYATDTQKMYQIKDNALSAIGGGGVGGLDIMFVQDFEDAKLADFTQTGLTISETVGEVLHGEKTAKLVHDAAVNQYFKEVKSVDEKFRGKNVTIHIEVQSNASAGNVTLTVYDETNAADLVTSEQLELAVDGTAKTSVAFDIPSTCESISYTVTALPEAGSPVTLVDDILAELTQIEVMSALVEEQDSILNAGSNSSEVITAAVTDIPFSLISNTGDKINFTGSTFSVNESALYTISSGVHFTAASNRAIELYADGVRVYRFGDNTVESTHKGSITFPLTAGVEYSIRVGGTGGTLSNLTAAENHYLVVSRQGSVKQVAVNSNQKITIPTSELRFEGCSALGTVATQVAKFDAITKMRGDAFEVVSTTEDGTYVRVKKAGKLSISATLYRGSAVFYLHIAKNKSDLTTSTSLASEIMATNGSHSSTTSARQVSWTGNVQAGDVFRVIPNTTPTASIYNMLNLSFQEQDIQVSVSNTLPQFSESDSSIRVTELNGYGSSATMVQRFSSVLDNIGTDIEYTDSATDGASFVVKSAGIYSASYYTSFSADFQYAGISKNASSLSTAINSLTSSEKLAVERSSGTNNFVSVSWTGYLEEGDIIRPHTGGGANASVAGSFTISKVGRPQVTGVDVTPFVNVPLPETQSSTYFSTAVTSVTTFTGTLTTTKGSGIYSYDSSTGLYTMLKSGKVDLSLSVRSNTTAATVSYIFVNGVAVAIDYADASTNWGASASFSTELEVGDTFQFQSNANAKSYVSLSAVATTTSESIVTPTESFSTDTASLTYASSSEYTLSTLEDAPVGTFITFTYAASTNTRTQTTTAPTQTTDDMNQNGIQIFARAYNASSNAGNPAAVAIQVGKGHKGTSLNLYKNAGKDTEGSLDSYMRGSDAVQGGVFYKEYNEVTGILYIDVGYAFSGVTSREFRFSDLTPQANGYLVINASKSPALAGVPHLLPRVATIRDVKATSTDGGSSIAGTQTRVLNDLNDPFGIVTSLASNQFTLEPGTYYFDVSAPAYHCDRHNVMLYNVTDATTALTGSAEYANTTSNTSNRSFLSGSVKITAAKTFSIRHQTNVAQASNGLGVSCNTGDSVFTTVKIQKLKD